MCPLRKVIFACKCVITYIQTNKQIKPRTLYNSPWCIISLCGVYFFIYITADKVPICTKPSSSPSSSSSSSSSSLTIQSVEELILTLPTIDDPRLFGLHLGVGYARCKQLIKDNGSGINSQVQAIAAEWYRQSPHPSWNDVVEALRKLGNVRDAVLLASKVGLESSPLPQEDGDSDHVSYNQ